MRGSVNVGNELQMEEGLRFIIKQAIDYCHKGNDSRKDIYVYCKSMFLADLFGENLKWEYEKFNIPYMENFKVTLVPPERNNESQAE